MERPELVDLLAEILAGLQVPLSISAEAGFCVLGAAEEPYCRLLAETGFGWRTKEDFVAVLEEGL